MPGLRHSDAVVRIARPWTLLLLSAALAVPAVPAVAGTGAHRAETRRKPPVTEDERVTATVSPGLLLISVGSPRRIGDDGRVHRTEPLEVVVRDGRPGSPGWSLGGIAHGFAERGGTAAVSDQIRWTPRLVAGPGGGGVTVTPSGVGEPIEQDPGAASRQLASGAAGTSFGTSVVAVGLSVPLSAEEALFAGDVTFTVL